MCQSKTKYRIFYSLYCLIVLQLILQSICSTAFYHPDRWCRSSVHSEQYDALSHWSLGNFNTLRRRHNGRHFADDIFKCIFLNENVWIPIKISLKFVPKGSINNIPALVQIMAWRRPGDKPLSEPMMFSLPTHICITRPQWVNEILYMQFSNRF